MRYARYFVKGVPVIVVAIAGGNAIASGGDAIDVASAIGAEVFMKDVVHGGVRFIVIDPAGNLLEQYVNPVEHVNKRFGSYISDLDRRIMMQKAFEINKTRSRGFRGLVEGLWGCEE